MDMVLPRLDGYLALTAMQSWKIFPVGVVSWLIRCDGAVNPARSVGQHAEASEASGVPRAAGMATLAERVWITESHPIVSQYRRMHPRIAIPGGSCGGRVRDSGSERRG